MLLSGESVENTWFDNLEDSGPGEGEPLGHS